jgi:tetratricopeptide (TPR) repeat protein
VCAAARATLAWLEREGASDVGVGGIVGTAIRARAAFARGDKATALAAMDDAVAMEPDRYAWRLGRLEALVALKRWNEADEAVRAAARTYHPAARTGPAYDAYLEALHAEVAAARGLRDEAVEAGRKALAQDPLDVATRRMLRRPGIN